MTQDGVTVGTCAESLLGICTAPKNPGVPSPVIIFFEEEIGSQTNVCSACAGELEKSGQWIITRNRD